MGSCEFFVSTPRLWMLTSKARRPKLYFVKTDVKKAFDTINHGKLLEVLQEILDRVRSNAYAIRSTLRMTLLPAD